MDPAGARRGSWMFPMMFWGGIGLAPLAALLILLGNGGTPVRMGAVMGVMAPVMIAVSFALRPDPDSIRLQFEETLLEELDILRSEVRDEIANSARTSHQMVGERLGALQHTVDTLRASSRAAPIAPPQPPALAPPAAPYQVTASAAPPPVTSRAAVPRSAAPRAAAPPTSAAPPPMMPRSAPPPRYTQPASAAPVPGNGRASVTPPPAGRRAAGRPARHQADGYAPPAGGRAAPPAGGVYRRTDTGQIPRPGYGDDPGRNGRAGYNGAGHNGAGYNGAGYNGAAGGGAGNGAAGNGAGYGPAGNGAGYPPASGSGAGYGGQDWSPPAPRGRPAEPPYEESWTDQKLRERYGRRPRPYGDDTNGGGESWRQGEEVRWEPVISAEPVTRGRRRRWEEDSSVDLRGGRPTDTGTQPAYDARWSAVRDEPNGYSNGNGYGNARPDYTRRALPAGSSEPPEGGRESWNDSWEEPVRDTRSRRYRPDFEVSDERWR